MQHGKDSRTEGGHETTVVIPWWNRPDEWLRGAVESVRSQDVAARVIVVDNRSDTPPPVIEGVELLCTQRRGSVGYARNAGLELVETDTVVFLDADDELLPGSLRRLAQLLDERPGAVAAQGAQTIWDSDAGTERPDAWPFPWMVTLQRRLEPHRRAYAFLQTTRILYPIHGALLRTEAVRDAGGFADSNYGEDWALGISLSLRGTLALAPELTYRYRRSSQVTSLHREMQGLGHRGRMAIRAQLRAHLRGDARCPWLLRSWPARALLFAIHHAHNAWVRARVHLRLI